ncbi:hypothetical protein AVEN_239679-1 [Araneus ventricosus]|uniref:Uncharacterized protein n=1 Tax=Araneus ventricosus TaxID=182803 RepID=A0A4Y2CS72_ARAVE|nr:hypothetical protein AVEN_239679-1 [Araneus ventricosus]
MASAVHVQRSYDDDCVFSRTFLLQARYSPHLLHSVDPYVGQFNFVHSSILPPRRSVLTTLCCPALIQAFYCMKKAFPKLQCKFRIVFVSSILVANLIHW